MMTAKAQHRRTPSNDGTIETFVSTSPSRTSSSSSNMTMDTTTTYSENANHKDVELGPLITNILPTRGRSYMNINKTSSNSNNETNALLSNDTNNDNDGSTSDKGSSAANTKISGTAWKAISACFNYSFCSVSMILVNKSLASSYNHLIVGDLNILLVVIQAIVAVIFVEGFKHLKWIEHYPALSWDVAKSWAPVNLFFCAMLFTGMASLQTNSVPMVTVFKNITNIITTFGDYVYFGNKPDTLVMAAFGIMLFGALAAAWNDLTISSVGLFWMGANCLSTAGYVLYMKFATVNVKLTKFGMVYVNNVLCTLFLLPAAYMKGEITTFINTNAIHTGDYFMKNIFAGFVGFFLNYASLSCVQATGPTTYAIVGSMNKIPVAFLGYILFDSIITYDTWCYIGVSMAGGFLYSYAQLKKPHKHSK